MSLLLHVQRVFLDKVHVTCTFLFSRNKQNVQPLYESTFIQIPKFSGIIEPIAGV